MSVQFKNHLTLIRRRLSGTFLRFSLVGVSNFIVDLGVFNLLILTLFSEATFISYTLARVMAVGAAIANSFLWNRSFVFEDDRPARQTIAKFFIVSITAAGLNVGVYMIALAVLERFMSVGWLSGNLATLLAITGSLLFNFYGYRNFVFTSQIGRN